MILIVISLSLFYVDIEWYNKHGAAPPIDTSIPFADEFRTDEVDIRHLTPTTCRVGCPPRRGASGKYAANDQNTCNLIQSG